MISLLAGCTAEPPTEPDRSPAPSVASPSSPAPPSSTPPSSSTPPNSTAPAPTPTRTATPSPTVPVEVDADRILTDIDRLADGIGPREATSEAFYEAADLVQDRLDDLGFRTMRTDVEVPAGDSWGTRVRAGTSANIIADSPGLDPERDHVVIGAHLDTVAVSPGAEDNASGVAMLLELARLVSVEAPAVPVRFIAFGAEEPRGEGDALHHFGSQQLVAELSGAERRAIRAMVALDRVGVRADYVPVCRGGPHGRNVQDQLRAAARSAKITTRGCENRASDHWSYEKAEIPAARLGSIAYSGYHSRNDRPSVVDRGQLDRGGRLMWAWLERLK